jgi:hypothetical protein
MTLLDNGHAHEIGNTPGRCVYQFDREAVIQVPLINDEIIRNTVEDAIAGAKSGALAAGHDVTIIEILTWALDNNTGWLAVKNVYERFRERGVGREEVEGWLKEAEGQEFVIGSSLYRVNKSAGTRGRRIVAIEAEDSQDEEIEVVS